MEQQHAPTKDFFVFQGRDKKTLARLCLLAFFSEQEEKQSRPARETKCVDEGDDGDGDGG